MPLVIPVRPRSWISPTALRRLACAAAIAVIVVTGRHFGGTVPLVLASGLAILFGMTSLWLHVGNHRLRTRISILETTSTEAWAVAMAAREDLQRAQDGWHRMGEELKAARDQAVAANHARAMFVAGMSHELRTPLNAIIGFSEVLELELFGAVGSARNREYVRDIRVSGQHLLSMINDILDMSKVDAGKMALHENVVDVVHLIADCCRLMRTRAADAGIDLAVEVTNAPALPVMADEVRLKQVLLNLLTNAAQAMEGFGRIQVKSWSENGQVLISVQDNGCGMPREVLERIFDPFYTTKPVGQGTGLGLALTKSLIELHRGQMTIDSEPGRGTTVWFDLPVCAPAGAMAPLGAPIQRVQRAA